MLNTATIQNNWDRVRERARQKWSQLQESDLQQFDENFQELVTRIQQKTGESRDSIERFLESASEEGASFVNRVRDQVEETASSARESLGKVAGKARDGFQQAQARTGQVVQDRPVMSLGVAFGLGVLVGVGLSLWLIDFESESMSRRYARRAETFGRKFWDTIARQMPESLSRAT